MEPDPRLRSWVAAYWSFRVAPGTEPLRHWIPQTGGAMLAAIRHGPLVVQGPSARPLETTVSGGLVIWGAHFWPGTARALLGDPGFVLRDRRVEARAFLTPEVSSGLTCGLAAVDAPELACAILDRFLLEQTSSATPLDEPVMRAVFRIITAAADVSLADVAHESGLSVRQFRRRFSAATELKPIELVRLQRLRDAANDAVGSTHAGGKARWSELAARHGYSDQAHLVREFRRTLGLAPAKFARHAGRIEHGRLLR